MYQNFVFDLYGTLVDIKTDEYSKNFYKKYTKWLRKRGFYFTWKEFENLYKKIEMKYRKSPSEYQNPEIQIEKVFDEVFQQKGYMLTEQQIWDLCESFRKVSLIYLRLFPDTITCLQTLKDAGKKIYLLSNAQKSFTWQELELTGIIPFFDGILISSEEKCMKPDPAFFEILCHRYQLDKSKTLMIGNEIKSDMAVAKASGIDGLLVNREPVYHKEKDATYPYVSVNGSLMEVLKYAE